MTRPLLLLLAVTACATARPEPVSGNFVPVLGGTDATVHPIGRLVPGHLHCCGGRDGACVLHSALQAFVDKYPDFLARYPELLKETQEKLLDKGDDIWPANGGAK